MSRPSDSGPDQPERTAGVAPNAEFSDPIPERIGPYRILEALEQGKYRLLSADTVDLRGSLKIGSPPNRPTLSNYARVLRETGRAQEADSLDARAAAIRAAGERSS